MKKYAWGFIALVTAADVAFALACRHSMVEWEANPIARWIAGKMGVAGAILFRLGLLAYAVAMARAKSRLSWLVTPAWSVVHLALVVVLVQAYAAAGLLPAGPARSTSLPVATLHH